MALVLDEGTSRGSATLLLGNDRLAVRYQITMESMRGVDEPTWYGSFSLVEPELHVLPGAYTLLLPGGAVQVLIYRPAGSSGRAARFAFWGVGAAPAVEREALATREA